MFSGNSNAVGSTLLTLEPLLNMSSTSIRTSIRKEVAPQWSHSVDTAIRFVSRPWWLRRLKISWLWSAPSAESSKLMTCSKDISLKRREKPTMVMKAVALHVATMSSRRKPNTSKLSVLNTRAFCQFGNYPLFAGIKSQPTSESVHQPCARGWRKQSSSEDWWAVLEASKSWSFPFVCVDWMAHIRAHEVTSFLQQPLSNSDYPTLEALLYEKFIYRFIAFGCMCACVFAGLGLSLYLIWCEGGWFKDCLRTATGCGQSFCCYSTSTTKVSQSVSQSVSWAVWAVWQTVSQSINQSQSLSLSLSPVS